MSKNCTICGAEIPDGAQVCGICGTPAPGPAAPAYAPNTTVDPLGNPSISPAQNYDPLGGTVPDYGTPAYGAPINYGASAAPVATKKPDVMDLVKKFGPIVGGVVAIIIVIAVIASIAGGGYKKAVKKYINALYTGDAETYCGLTSKLFTQGVEVDPENMEDYFDELVDELEDKYGSNYKVKIEIVDTKKLDQDDIDDLYDDNYYGDEDDLDDSDITAGYKVKVKFEIKGSEDSDDDTVRLYVLKEKGEWKIYPAD